MNKQRLSSCQLPLRDNVWVSPSGTKEQTARSFGGLRMTMMGEILRRPQDDKDGVVDMAYAFVDAWAEQPDPSEASG
jgi:hypothetical protein